MMTDMEASLSVSLDLSSVVEEALRSAVCSVLSEIQRLIGKDVAELRAAVARKDCENKELRAQLESARRELQEQARVRQRYRRHGGVAKPCDLDESDRSCTSRPDTHRVTHGGASHLYLGHGSLAFSHNWDQVTRHDFTDRLENLKQDLTLEADYSVDTAESEPDLVSGPESLVTNPTLRKNEDSDLDNASAAMDLRVVEVKEEVAPSQGLSAAVESAGSTRPKPYICGDCGKSYLWLKNLKKHQKIHTGEAPFSCKICCRLFSSQQVLEEHQRVHTGERPHRCTSCPKTFNHLSNLKKHQLIHTGEKPHHCSLCGKRFRQIQHLKEHRKTHEDSKPFRCWECGWGFNHGSNFKRHLLVHTRQKMRHGLAT
ncbi:zinc finger protein 112-like [Brienomyrus brachyistius]|uniref:zinc finger protein 112-like n=1 Tax=Brienomyrus brachyistius TaxID=42636 RepID=UPI0020B25D41|nr:zinc finger protein 112-like [Brienomyrus brachyistius]